MRALACLLLVIGLAACGAAPDGEMLHRDVAGRLAQALPPGTVALSALERRGSQSDTRATDGETRRIVYFDAELKLERDYDFGAWDSPGVAGIVSALGAGPRGITGLVTGGNKAGDVLRVHGTALYRREAGTWRPLAPGGYAPVPVPSQTAGPREGAAGMLEAMRGVIESVPRDITPAASALVAQELAVAQANIRAVLERAMNGYAIAAGPEHGQYLRFAQALADDSGLRILPLMTRGGEDNLRLLRGGRVPLALSQADAVLAAYRGSGPFAADGPNAGLQVIGSLYPEPVHVIVRFDSPFASMANLAGRRIAVGPQGSASRTTALRVLEAHGLQAERAVKLSNLGLGDGLVALRSGRVDAVIQVIGTPADSIRDALAAVPLRLLPLSGRAIASLGASRAGYFAHTIPRGAYAAQNEDVPTVATAALLLAAADLSETEIAAITRHVFGGRRDLAARGSAQGTQVTAANARLGLPIPQHAAAVRVLETMTSAATPGSAADADGREPVR